MKVLLDENLPHQLRLELPGHEVFTAAFMKWSGIENGRLLAVASEAGFDVRITNDRGLEYQQNIEMLPPGVVVLLAKGNTVEAIRPLLPALLDALRKLRPRQFARVELL